MAPGCGGRVPQSIFEHLQPAAGTELFDVLFEGSQVRIERIVSSGSQPRTRYVQPHDEWVLLVQGSAELLLDGATVRLRAGDTLLLPADVPHEVVSTSKNAVWLAVHILAPRAGE